MLIIKVLVCLVVACLVIGVLIYTIMDLVETFVGRKK